MSDDLTLKLDGQSISGWQEIRVTCGIERAARDFSIVMTEKYPLTPDVVVKPGQTCEVFLGKDKVITGYVDVYAPQFDAHSHSITVTGRSKTADMIDCSATLEGSQILQGNLLQIANRLLNKQFGISVRALDDTGDAIPVTALNLGDSVFNVLEPIARYRSLLLYDDAEGNLVFARTQDKKAASGFAEGQNVEAAGMAYSMAERFSEYSALRVHVSAFGDTAGEDNLIARVEDKNVPRFRPMFFVAETAFGGFDVAKQRAAWELNRRVARSAAVHLACDSWRDSAGKLWEPNTLATISLPSLKLPTQQWLIGEVSYIKNAAGTHSQIVMMHPDGFKPQPMAWPFPMLLSKALEAGKKQ